MDGVKELGVDVLRVLQIVEHNKRIAWQLATIRHTIMYLKIRPLQHLGWRFTAFRQAPKVVPKWT